MKTVRAAFLSVSCLVLASACGDGGVKAADYDGTWLITSLTMPTATGGSVTLTRDGTPDSLRGDVLFTATGDTAAALNARQLVLANGLPVGEAASTDLTVKVEDGRWVLTEPGGVTVFTTMMHGEELMLTRDDADPRTTTTDSPTEIMLMPVTPWSTTCVGAWDLMSMTNAAGVITADTCTEVMAGQRWAKVQMLVSFDSRLLFSRTMTMTGYSDAACTHVVSTDTSVQTGLAEEETSTLLRLWGVDGATAEHLAFTMTMAGDVMTLTRTACLPMPGCQADAPTTVVVKRH